MKFHDFCGQQQWYKGSRDHKCYEVGSRDMGTMLQEAGDKTANLIQSNIM